MPYKIPWSNFHELNLDWLLEQVKVLRTDVDDMMGAATPSDVPPLADGTADAGTSINYSRGDHVHPTDTSRAAASALTTETLDRQNADLALSGRIDTLSDRVVPSDAYPLMDGAAESGSNVEYSRRDHRHPTDTSRAAASDLTQEINDRGNADITLQTNIDTVDAKIKFSAAAPLMDSNSASPGFSDYQARADHVHPTDTSRASQDDFNTLKARVDAFEGSSNPSDSTPLMDGVGAAGTGGNYSRGDHVHPSDTSKLDKSGGTITGDLTVEGSFTAEDSETFVQTNASGWLRVIAAPVVQGSLINIAIVRKGSTTPGEVHKITFVNNTSPYFQEEVSTGDELYINKIRYSNAGYIDIHMDQTYQADIAVKINAIAPTKQDADNIKTLKTVSFVADAPAGETISEEYTFVQNTGVYASVDLTSTPITAQANTTLGSVVVPKSHKRMKGYIFIRSTNAVNKMLLEVLQGATMKAANTAVTADYMQLSFDIDVTQNATIKFIAYLYDSAANSIQNGAIYYEFK